jgi:hypothetical protein
VLLVIADLLLIVERRHLNGSLRREEAHPSSLQMESMGLRQRITMNAKRK